MNGLAMLQSLKEWRGILERVRLPNVAISFTPVQLDLLVAALELAESCEHNIAPDGPHAAAQWFSASRYQVYCAHKGKP